ncbi:HAMP domain-containing protein, partial [Streptomyces brasiliscabiei]
AWWEIGVSAFGTALLLGSLAVSFWFIQRQVVRPILQFTAVIGHFAGGDLAAAVPNRDRRDELGAMARALIVLRDAAAAARELE